MRRLYVVSLTVVLFLMIFVSACSSKPSPEATAGPETAEPQFADFDPDNFDNSTDINNEWMPMQPGTRWVYEGTAVDDEATALPVA